MAVLPGKGREERRKRERVFLSTSPLSRRAAPRPRSGRPRAASVAAAAEDGGRGEEEEEERFYARSLPGKKRREAPLAQFRSPLGPQQARPVDEPWQWKRKKKDLS